MVPGLPESLVRQIVSRAEGIPLYAVETVRMLLNDRRIERDWREPDERQRAADEAREIFTRLGARPFVERLEAALSSQPAGQARPALKTPVDQEAPQPA